MATDPHYEAFISYSHSADGRFAPALQTGLQRFARTWRERRAMTVFRDETGLAVNPDLWGSIVEALDASHRFLLLASPGAAGSTWVGEEIARALTTKGPDGLLIVITDGTATWDEQAGDFSTDSDAIHPTLRGRLVTAPNIIDMTWAKSETDLTLDNPRFRADIAHLVALIRGESVERAIRRDQAAQRTTRQVLTTAVGLLAVAAVGAVTAASVAATGLATAAAERDRAEREARVALSYEFAAHARSEANTVREQMVLAGLAESVGDDAAAAAYEVSLEEVTAARALDDTALRPAFALATEAHALNPSDESLGALVSALATAVYAGLADPPSGASTSPPMPAAASIEGRVTATIAPVGTSMMLIVADHVTGAGAEVAVAAVWDDCDGCAEVAVSPDGRTVVVRLAEPSWSTASFRGEAISFAYADGSLEELARRTVSGPGIVRFADDGQMLWLRDEAAMLRVSPQTLDDGADAIPVVRTGPIRFGSDRYGIAPATGCAPPALISGTTFAALGDLPMADPDYTEGGCVYADADAWWESATSLVFNDHAWPVDNDLLAQWACEVLVHPASADEIHTWTGAVHEPTACRAGAQ